MSGFPLALLLGFVVGFLGAIPPGPLNLTIIQKASRHEGREAFRVGLGGSIVDALICSAIALGFSGILERATANPWVKAVLALFLLVYGLKVLLVDRRRDAEARAREGRAAMAAVAALEKAARRHPHLVARPDDPAAYHLLVGFLQGAANPALIVNWTLLVGFLVGHNILHSGLQSSAGFAVGVGFGVFCWFALLIQLVERLKDHPAGAWIRSSTLIAGMLLVAFGIAFSWKALVALSR